MKKNRSKNSVEKNLNFQGHFYAFSSSEERFEKPERKLAIFSRKYTKIQPENEN